MATTLASDADVLREVEAFLDHTGLPVTTFGRRAIGDANLVDNLRAGRELRRATRARLAAFMASYRANTDDLASAAARTPQQAEAA